MQNGGRLDPFLLAPCFGSDLVCAPGRRLPVRDAADGDARRPVCQLPAASAQPCAEIGHCRLRHW